MFSTLTFLLLTSCVMVDVEEFDDYVGLSRSISVRNVVSEPPSSPTGPLEVTVEEAVLLALENNRALAVERLRPAIRRTAEKQERAAFDPAVTAGASGSRSRTKQDATDTLNYSTGADAGVSKKFPTGTQVSAGASTARNWSSSPGDSHATRLGLSVTQALLRGAGRGANLASIRQARLDTLASQYELRGFAEALVARVETTYWDYALARRQIEIYTNSLKLAGQQLSETKERIKVGKLAGTELAAAEAQVALRKEDLINARSTLAKTRLQLLRLLSPSGADRWKREVTLRDEPAVPDEKLDDVKLHVELALQQRPELNQAKLSLRRGDIEIVRTKNGLLPRMDFFLTLGKTGYAESFHSSVKNFNSGSYDISAGLTLEFPLGNRAARARHRHALLGREQAAEALANLVQLVQVEVRCAHIEVNRAREQVTATAATRRLREETLRCETEKFRVGKSTTFLVAQTQRDLVASQVAEVQAIVTYLKALVELYRLDGSLLERRRISAPGFKPVKPEERKKEEGTSSHKE